MIVEAESIKELKQGDSVRPKREREILGAAVLGAERQKRSRGVVFKQYAEVLLLRL
jgi:hypothetical protein